VAPSRRAEQIPPFLVMDVLERAQQLEAQGQHIVHMEVGEPDFDTPEPIKHAALKALEAGHTHYTHSMGIPQLRQAIAAHYHKHYGVSVDPERIIVTSGSSPGLLLVFMALLEPGEEVVLTDPCYACYPNFVEFVGGRINWVRLDEGSGFQPEPELIASTVTARTRAIVLNSPSNPTGQIITPQRLEAIAALAQGGQEGPWIVSDEIYHGLCYGAQARSILEFTPNAFVLGGFSKLYAMTGWRLGYIIAPEPFVRPLQKMHQNFAICAPSVAQWAAIAAVEQCQEDVARMVHTYDQRRRHLLAGLKRLGFPIPVEPTGAFYVFTRCDHLDPDDYSLAFHILDHARVALTPGRDFGPSGRGHLRFSYATSIDNITEGLKRLEEYLRRFYPSVVS